MKPTRVLFVCHGNICRSPMAEMIFKELARERGVEDRFEVASAATSTEEIGNDVYPPARAELARRRIPCERRRAVQMTKADYNYYDKILVMDRMNLRNLNRLLGGDTQNKVEMLMDYTARGGDVADPWYSDRFDVAFRDIDEGCRGLMDALIGAM